MRGRPARNGPHDISPARVPDAADVARVLDRADRITARSAAALSWLRWHGHAEYERGFRAGYEARAAELEADWHAVADPAARAGLPQAELESRRWGPGGRDRFADPRPGDYRGRGDAA